MVGKWSLQYMAPCGVSQVQLTTATCHTGLYPIQWEASTDYQCQVAIKLLPLNFCTPVSETWQCGSSHHSMENTLSSWKTVGAEEPDGVLCPAPVLFTKISTFSRNIMSPSHTLSPSPCPLPLPLLSLTTSYGFPYRSHLKTHRKVPLLKLFLPRQA